MSVNRVERNVVIQSFLHINGIKYIIMFSTSFASFNDFF